MPLRSIHNEHVITLSIDRWTPRADVYVYVCETTLTR